MRLMAWLRRLLIIRCGDCIRSPLFLKLYLSGDFWRFSVPMFWVFDWWIYQIRYGSKRSFRRSFAIPRVYLCFGVPIWFHRSIETPMNYDFGRQRGPAILMARSIVGFGVECVLWPFGEQERVA